MKRKLIMLLLFLKYVKKEMTFDDIYKLKKTCKEQSESYLWKP